jgi:3-oxoacyl-[acyl-carrier-protein] synthase-3
MRWESVYVAGTGAWLPEPLSARAAVEAGEYDPEQFEADGLLSVRVAGEDIAPPDMAVQAATTALKRSGLAPEAVRLLLHNYVWFQGQTMWPVASYVADHAVHWNVPAFEVKQECNAAIGSLELAARQLTTEPDEAAAVLTTADRFAEPLINRWSAEAGLVYADGGTSLVLSNRDGFARVLSTVTRADNRMEALARGAGLTPLPTQEPYEHAGRFAHYLRSRGGNNRPAGRHGQGCRRRRPDGVRDQAGGAGARRHPDRRPQQDAVAGRAVAGSAGGAHHLGVRPPYRSPRRR